MIEVCVMPEKVGKEVQFFDVVEALGDSPATVHKDMVKVWMQN
jgi:hypothetical protein